MKKIHVQAGVVRLQLLGRFSEERHIARRRGGGAVSLVIEVVEVVLRPVVTQVALEVHPGGRHKAQRAATDEVIRLGELVVVLKRIERIVVLRSGSLKIRADI